MLKFFRRIRQRLLADGKVKNYALYAIGEILLVVVGILIALQVNNWSTNQAKKKEEIKILKELNTELDQSNSHLKRNLLVQKKSYQSILVIMDHIENNLPYHDSLDQHFGLAFEGINSWLNQAAFETLKSKGIDLISNDSLRRGIVGIYDAQYDVIQAVEKGIWIEYNYINEYCLGFFDKASAWAKNEKGKWQPGKIKPLNFEALKRDQKFLSVFKTLKSQTEFNTEVIYPGFVNQIEVVLKDIQQEIKNLE